MIESGAIGAGGASAIQKASKFTEILDTVAVEAKQLHAAAKPAIKKATKAISNAVDDLMQPVGDTGMGVKMPIPKDHLKDETKMLMSKADDGEKLPRRRTKHNGGEIQYQIDKTTGRLQRIDFGKMREPYYWKALNEHFSPDVVRQSHDGSCISAVGEMLTNGAITEKTLIAKIGAPSFIEKLPGELGAEWSAAKRSTSFAELGKNGPWAAEMLETGWPKKPPHLVVVDGVNEAGNIMIRDPWEGTKYEMQMKHFIEDVWTGRAVYRT